jgi:hypothetical protein
MSARTREVMFRIGGEEDLLDCLTAEPAGALRPKDAAIPTPPKPLPVPAQAAWPLEDDILPAPTIAPRPAETLIKTEAEVADLPAHAILAQPAEADTTSEAGVLDVPAPAAPAGDVPTPDPPAREVPARPIRAPASPPHPRRRGAHHGRDASRRYRSIPPPMRCQRPGLVKLSSCIAWVNALILTVLVVAGVIGHAPASTASRERPSTITRATARPAVSAPVTRLEFAQILRKALARKHRVLPPRHRRDVADHPSVWFGP